MTATATLLDRIERYYDTVHRGTAFVEEHGPFTLFVGRGPIPLYARPRTGRDASLAVPADIEVVLARQRALGVPHQFEWVEELAPGLAAVATAAGLTVARYPLLVLERLVEPVAAVSSSDGSFDVRVAPADDPGLLSAKAAIFAAFRAGGTDPGEAGTAARDEQLVGPAGTAIPQMQEQIASGDLVMAVATTVDGAVGGGSASPRGDVAELMGIATLPAYRRRGIGMAITATLTAELRRRDVDLAFLTAGSDAVARIYEKAGYQRLATACIATMAD